MFNILVTPPVNEKHKAMLENACPGGDFHYVLLENVKEEDVKEADVIIGNIPLDLVGKCERLKLLHLNMAGADGYPERMPEGAVLANSSGAYGLAISEHMLGMLLSIKKKLYNYHANQLHSLWQDEGGVTSIEDAVVLSVGMGDIGGEFTRKCKLLGAYTMGIRRTLREGGIGPEKSRKLSCIPFRSWTSFCRGRTSSRCRFPPARTRTGSWTSAV